MKWWRGALASNVLTWSVCLAYPAESHAGGFILLQPLFNNSQLLLTKLLVCKQAQLLPIRLDLAEDPGFEKVLGKACTALDRAKQHSGLQLEQLVEASGGHMPSGHIPSHPLYQAAFLMRLQGQPHANAVHEELERFMYVAPVNSAAVLPVIVKHCTIYATDLVPCSEGLQVTTLSHDWKTMAYRRMKYTYYVSIPV